MVALYHMSDILMRMIVEPSVGIVLVRLANSNFGTVSTVEKKFDSITRGEIIKVSKDDETEFGYLVGRVGHWREYKDDARVKLPDGTNGAFIDIADILGTSWEE